MHYQCPNCGWMVQGYGGNRKKYLCWFCNRWFDPDEVVSADAPRSRGEGDRGEEGAGVSRVTDMRPCFD